MIWNSAYYWGIPAKILHWVAAVLLVAIYADGVLVLEDWRTRGGAGHGALAWHAAAGLSLAAFMLARLLWRVLNRTPMMPAATPEWERMAARAAHSALYAATFLVALTGWLMTARIEPPLAPKLFWLLGLPAPAFVSGLDLARLHAVLAHLLMALAAAHALAALWHHFVKHDSVLRRMLLRGRNPRARSRRGESCRG